MRLLEELVAAVPDAEVRHVLIGLHWTAVVVDHDGDLRCGLASTLGSGIGHSDSPDVLSAGQLHTLPARTLVRMALSDQATMASVGIAAINALLPLDESAWRDVNASEVIAEQGAGKTVALVGHFPFINELRPRVGTLHILELNPRPGDYPASDAATIIPQADVVAITGTTLINHTLENLLDLCRPDARLLLLGPSTPLSPILYDYGFDLLSGSIVSSIDPVLQTIMQGAHFPQVHRAGVRLVTMTRSEVRGG